MKGQVLNMTRRIKKEIKIKKAQNDLFANGDLGLTLPVIEELIDINNNIVKGLERQLELLQETTLDC